jgi:hypothetical protein
METIKPRIHPQRKRKEITNHAMVSPDIAAEFLRFMEYHPAERVKKNIRKMLFEFLMSEGGVENLYLKDLLYDLEGLFELLDVIEVADRQKKE